MEFKIYIRTNKNLNDKQLQGLRHQIAGYLLTENVILSDLHFEDIQTCSDSMKESEDEQEWAFDEKTWKGHNSTPTTKTGENN